MEPIIKNIKLNEGYFRKVLLDNGYDGYNRKITLGKMYFSNQQIGATLEEKLERENNKYNRMGDFYGEFLLKHKKKNRYDLYYIVLRPSNKTEIREKIVDPDRFCVYKIKDKFILVEASRTLRRSV